MHPSVEDVVLLAQVSGLRLPPEDLAPVAAALERYLASVEPLLRADLDEVNPALTHDPRWRG